MSIYLLPNVPVSSVPPSEVKASIVRWIKRKYWNHQLNKALNNELHQTVHIPPDPNPQDNDIIGVIEDYSSFNVKYQLVSENTIRTKNVIAQSAVEAFRIVVNYHCNNNEILRSMISIREVSNTNG
jgi:hypothetical protein